MAATSSFAISPSTSTVSGTVTSDQGAPNTAANGWPVKVTDGTNTAAVKPASTAAQATDPASVVALSPNSPLPSGSNALGSVSVSNFPGTQPVSGTVAVSNFPATQNVAVTNSPTVSVSNFPATQPISGTVAVSNFPATQPVSGTVAVTQSTSPWVTSVSNFPATQPVSGTVAVSSLPSIPAGVNAIGSVSVSNFPATQAVSAVSLPLPAGAATAALQTSTINAIQASYDAYKLAQQVAPITNLFSYSFTTSTIDSTFFNNASATGGTATAGSGLVTLSSGTSATGTAWLISPSIYWAAGSQNVFSCYARTGDTGAVGSIRAWGPFNLLANGCYFELTGTSFGVTTLTGGTATFVPAASFNVATFTLDTNVHYYQIIWTTMTVTFIIDGVIRHVATTTLLPVIGNGSLSVTLLCGNVLGGTTSRSLTITDPSVQRIGSQYGYAIATTIVTATTTVLKSGAGILRGISIGQHGTSSGTLTVYDNTAGSGKVLASVDLTATQLSLGTWGYKDIPFGTGLTVVTTGATISVSVQVE